MTDALGPTGIWLGSHLPHKTCALLVPAVLDVLPAIGSAWDLGCGRGEYVDALRAAGVEADGFEGTPSLAREHVRCADLTTPLTGPPRDLVLCIEVGEHVPAEHAASLRQNLAALCRQWLVLSWAVPGQSGFGHVNCQTNQAVIDSLTEWFAWDESRTDQLRAAVADCPRCPWLRDTLMVFHKEPHGRN